MFFGAVILTFRLLFQDSPLSCFQLPHVGSREVERNDRKVRSCSRNVGKRNLTVAGWANVDANGCIDGCTQTFVIIGKRRCTMLYGWVCKRMRKWSYGQVVLVWCAVWTAVVVAWTGVVVVWTWLYGQACANAWLYRTLLPAFPAPRSPCR